MAIHALDDIRMSTAPNAALVGNKVSFSGFVRVNSIKNAGERQGLFSLLYSNVSVSGPTAGGPQMILWSSLYFTDGSGIISARDGLAVGTLVHFAVVYDKDDPDRQFFAVNGVKARFSEPSNARLNVGGSGADTIVGGGAPADFEWQDYLLIDGYAMTDEDIEAILDDPSVTPTIGGDAPGLIRAYYSGDGPVGRPVRSGDPGVVAPGLPQQNFRDPAGPGSMTYTPRLSYAVSVGIEQAYVGSSGKSMTVSFRDSTSGHRMAVLPGSMVSPPSIRINGGAPIPLPMPLAKEEAAAIASGQVPRRSTLCSSVTQALFIPFPEGVRVVPGDVVTMEAPRGWAVTSLGAAPPLRAAPVSNRAGRPASMEDWPEPKEDMLRLGVNVGGMPFYGSVVIGNRNRAKDVSAQVPTWDDGTWAVDNTHIFCEFSRSNRVDKVGWKMQPGLYAVGWSDFDPAKPVDFRGEFGHYFVRCTERPEYHNPGDAAGRGKVRVFEIEPRVHQMTLGAPLDATSTTLFYEGETAYLTASTPENDTYATIEGEQIKLGKVDYAAKMFTECVRGWNGTTAAAHAAGTPFETRYTAQWGALKLTSISTDGHPHYVDWQVYLPEDWTPPDPPAPVVLPEPKWNDLNKSFESYFDGGCGVLRMMDGTQTMSSVSEIDHCVDKDDPHWCSIKLADQYFLKAARPFDPAVSPYVYGYYETPGSEKYAATLGAPVAAATPGAVSTITISDGRSAPILYGQELYVGGEIMRVVEIPKRSGTQYKVVRGTRGTAATAHPAGPIQVGWRIPITSESQWVRTNRAQYRAEVIIDEDLSSPLRLGNHVYKDGSDPDGSPLARRNLTFPAGIPAADGGAYQVVQVVPDDEDDWDWLAGGLTFAVGSEWFTIRWADRAAGTITLMPRGGAGANAHPPGSKATTRFSGILFGRPDGGGKAWCSPFWYSSICHPTGPDRYLVQMDYIAAYDPPEGGRGLDVVGYQEFEPRRVKSQLEMYPGHTMPYEWGPSVLRRKSPHGWYWVNVPHMASDDMVYEIARRTFGELLPTQKLVVELSNEVWNIFFRTQNSSLDAMSMLHGYGTDAYRFFCWRIGRVGEIFRQYAVSIGRPESDVINVAAWQHGFVGYLAATCRAVGSRIDAVSIAPYINSPSEPGRDPHHADYLHVFNGIDNDQACDLYRHFVEFSTEYLGQNAEAVRAADDHEQATGTRPLILYYEGGDASCAPQTDPSQPIQSIHNGMRSRDCRYNPLWWHVTWDLHSVAKRIWNCDAFAIYQLAYAPQHETPPLWCLTTNQWKKAGYGDGRNGGVDNRATLFTPGLPGTASLTESPDAVNEEVRLQSWKDYNAAYFAGSPPGPGGDPGEGPGEGPGSPDCRTARARPLVFRPRRRPRP